MQVRPLLALVLLWTASPALAWEQYRTLPNGADGAVRGCGLRWLDNAIALSVDVSPLDTLPTTDLAPIAAQAAATWEAVQCGLCEGCAGGRSVPTTCAAQPLGIHFLWTARGKPTEPGAECTKMGVDGCDQLAGNGNWINVVHEAALWDAQGMSKAVVAVTVLSYSRETGAIGDADVLLDDAHHDFCVSPACGPGQYDVQETLTHELGHVLGLDHSTVAASTMYANADAGETLKNSLEADDIAGVCTAYRTWCAACSEPAHGCDAAPPVGSTPPSAVWWALGVVVAGVLWRSRRPRASAGSAA